MFDGIIIVRDDGNPHFTVEFSFFVNVMLRGTPPHASAPVQPVEPVRHRFGIHRGVLPSIQYRYSHYFLAQSNP